MDEPLCTEQLEICRRIAERGLKAAQLRSDSEQIDLWQHMLDELRRLAVSRPLEGHALADTQRFPSVCDP
jgi:hypothetical protein